MRLRVIVLTAVATALFAIVAWGTKPYNTSGGWACFQGTCVIGHARAPAIQILTDGTGTGELALPAGSIDTTEVLDNTLTFVDVSNSSAIDATTSFTAADTISLELVPSATAGDTDFFVIDANQVDDANATDDFRAMVLELTSESGDAGDTFIGLAIEIEEGTANTIIDAAITIDNAETTASTLTDAILITSSGVNLGVTDGVDVSAANIANAINIGANLIMGTDDSLSVGATDDTVIFDSNDSAGSYICTDADANADCSFAGGGTGTATLGAAANTSAAIITDGGTATIDGYVQAIKGPFVTLASGALTINTIHLATAAADYDIPATACDASADIGTWVTVIVRDISEVIAITVDDTSNIMHAPGVALDADDELDSSGAATGDGEHITLVCITADNWYATDSGGVWADGGTAD